MSTTDTTSSREPYLFDTASDLGHEQMDFLAALLDATTTEAFEAANVGSGWRCLDVGAGGGSVSRWLAERVAPSGSVLAVELATDHLEESPGVRVLRHDITDGPPPGGPFDLIHARLVLLHLAEREEVFSKLVDALAPGGWLVLGEYGTRLSYALTARTPTDKDLFDHVQDVGHHVVGAAAGQSLEWAHQIHGHMTVAGLENVDSREFSRTMFGGDVGSLYHRNLITQLRGPILNAGITEPEFERYRELMLDPEFCAWFYQFVITRGQKPTA